MKNKYYNAICVLSEMVIECDNELKWKTNQLEMRDREIEKLKAKLESIENFCEMNVSKRK